MNNKKINTTEDAYEGWDDEFLWQRIEFAMNKKRKKKYFIYFVVLGGICVLSGLLFLKNSNDGKIKSISSNVNLAKDDDNKCIQTSNAINKTFHEIKFSQKNDSSKQITKNSLESSTKTYSTVSAKETIIEDSSIYNLNVVEYNKSRYQDIAKVISPDYTNSNSKINEYESLPVFLSLIPTSDFEKKPIYSEKFTSKNPMKKSNHSYHPLFIQYSVGIGLGHRKDRFDDQVEAQNLKHRNEKYVYSLSQSVEFFKSIHSNVQVGIGINYLSHISNLKGNNIEVKQKLVPSDSAIFQNIGGKNYYYSGYVLNTGTTKQSFDVYNSYSSLSVPFSIYFCKSLNKNQLFFSLGSALNVINLSKGHTYLDSGKIEEFESNNRKLNLELQYLSTSLGYRYTVYPRCYLSIAVENYLPIIFNKVQMYKSGQSFNSKYSYTGLELGVIYHLK